MSDSCDPIDYFESGQYISNTTVLTLASARDPSTTTENICCVCFQQIPDGEEVEIQDRKFHFDCFSCDLCKRKFGHDSYLVHENYVLHESCFDLVVSPRCFVCGGILADSTIIEGCGNFYHPHCFKCIKCQKPIKCNQVFYKPDGLLVCSSCFIHSHNLCLKCGQLTDDNCLKFLYQGEVYHFHNECAVCSVCDCELNLDNFHCIFGKCVCRSCWVKAMRRTCRKCAKPILPNDMLITHGEWHQDCFRCNICQQFVPFGNDVLIDGNCVYCANCKSFLKTHCAVCKKFVDKNGVEENGRVVHARCLCCAECKRRLAKMEEHVIIGDKVFCKKCTPCDIRRAT